MSWSWLIYRCQVELSYAVGQPGLNVALNLFQEINFSAQSWCSGSAQEDYSCIHKLELFQLNLWKRMNKFTRVNSKLSSMKVEDAADCPLEANWKYIWRDQHSIDESSSAKSSFKAPSSSSESVYEFKIFASNQDFIFNSEQPIAISYDEVWETLLWWSSTKSFRCKFQEFCLFNLPIALYSRSLATFKSTLTDCLRQFRNIF